MKTVDYPVDDIRHTASASLTEQVENLAAKLRAGFKPPPVWLDATGMLIDGNHRLHATIAARLPTICAVVLSDEQDDEFERLMGEDGIHPLDAYSAVTGQHSPSNFWVR